MLFRSLPWRPDTIFMQRFAGVADFGKELWVTEIVATGDGVWSSLVPEAVKANGWRQAVDALAACAQVTRLYYCWFTDKMHTMEAGVTQLGVVRYDGAPRELTTAFHETAMAHAPAASLIHRLHIAVAETTITSTDTVASLTFRLHNRGEEPLIGRASLELPPGLTADWASFAFELVPGQTIGHTFPLRVGALREAANHVFLRVEAAGQVHYGWGVVNCPQPLALDAKGPGIPHVSYLPDLEAVQDFLVHYGDQCAIVVGPGTGHWDVELGYRIKIILESLRGHSVPIVTWFMLPEVWDRPLIIVGRPTFNYCAQLVELALSAERRADGQGPRAGFVQRIDRPLGESIGSWNSELRGKMIGFHACPAALYIAGGDDAGSKAAAYDLIGRLWHPPAVPVPKAHWL